MQLNVECGLRRDAGQAQPLTTVVVAAYQQPAYLNEALTSLARQTWGKLEIIVVDDGSGREFTEQYVLPGNARLMVHAERRSTAAITRNTGVREAKGKYVAFLDQDDLYAPEKIAAQVELLEARPEAVLALTHYGLIDEGGKEVAGQPPAVRMEADFLRQLLVRNVIHCPSQVMMRRDVIERLGGFDEGIRGAADWDMWLRAAAAGEVVADERPLVLYRRHGAQWSKQSAMMVKGSLAVMEKAAGWLPGVRPELAGLVRRRRARWMREVVRVGLRGGADRQEMWRMIKGAISLSPMDVRGYRLAISWLWPRRTSQE